MFAAEVLTPAEARHCGTHHRLEHVFAPTRHDLPRRRTRHRRSSSPALDPPGVRHAKTTHQPADWAGTLKALEVPRVEEPRGRDRPRWGWSRRAEIVWLASLTAVYRVQPQSLPRNRDTGRVAAHSSSTRPQTARWLTVRPTPGRELTSVRQKAHHQRRSPRPLARRAPAGS
jgi:hypothetical protein